MYLPFNNTSNDIPIIFNINELLKLIIDLLDCDSATDLSFVNKKMFNYFFNQHLWTITHNYDSLFYTKEKLLSRKWCNTIMNSVNIVNANFRFDTSNKNLKLFIDLIKSGHQHSIYFFIYFTIFELSNKILSEFVDFCCENISILNISKLDLFGHYYMSNIDDKIDDINIIGVFLHIVYLTGIKKDILTVYNAMKDRCHIKENYMAFISTDSQERFKPSYSSDNLISRHPAGMFHTNSDKKDIFFIDRKQQLIERKFIEEIYFLERICGVDLRVHPISFMTNNI
jgi:hypothetical protein